MAGQLTRKELKQDKFAAEVGHTVDFFAAHRQQTIRYGAIILAIALIGGAVYYFRSSQQTVRQETLGDALTLMNAPVGSSAPGGGPSFPTEDARNAALSKAFTNITNTYGGSAEGYIAEYYLASESAYSGKTDDARKKYQDVIDHANPNFASLAKLALAQLDAGDNRSGDAEKLLKDLMDHPTDLVSKMQATIAYAKLIGPTQPEAARKMINGLMNPKDTTGVNQILVAALSDIPSK